MAMYEESIHKTFDRIRHSKLNAFITLTEEEAIKTATGSGRRQNNRKAGRRDLSP